MILFHVFTFSLLHDYYCSRRYSVTSFSGLQKRNTFLALSSSSQSNIPDLRPGESNHPSDDLFQSLSLALDKYILSGSLVSRNDAYNIYKRIESITQVSLEDLNKAKRMISRAGMQFFEEPDSDPIRLKLGETEVEKRKNEAGERRVWEGQFVSENDSLNNAVSATVRDKLELEKDLSKYSEKTTTEIQKQNFIKDAEKVASEIIAGAGAGTAFDGNALGIGGLDEVLSQVKRRIWVPLAAPPSLLQELGTHPVRGLLLYGQPGCGKTLLARSLGKILSPARPVTVISGPEIMDRFVGSSEANIRKIFDDPPGIYDSYRLNTPDSKALEKAALHVIIMDEFDAIARARGGQDGKGDQGDAGVARDSVVNQLLAKMDGVEQLSVPTLVIGLTNKRSLIDKALLRPGRFEVAIEVPPPRTIDQRMSILNIHMRHMFRNGRLLVRDAPMNSTAASFLHKTQGEQSVGTPSYEELLRFLAEKCFTMSGASLAAITRAAASRALERAVCNFSTSVSKDEQRSVSLDCVVTVVDFEQAIHDVLESSHDRDTNDATAFKL